MKKVMIVMLLVGFAISCQKVPITGRKQFVLIPNESVLPMSFTNYRQVLSTSQVVRSNSDAEMVRRVGNNLRQAMEQYLRANNLGGRLEGYQWEFNLIESPEVNAWCMPGGKVAFYTGILPYTQNEAGAAAVMGHEISHAIAEHGRERMSEGLVSAGLVQVGQSYLNSKAQQNPTATNAIFLQAVGAALPAGVAVARTLPHSRAQESEADKLGLIFMAMAGYNPQEAVSFWGRMSKAGGKKPAEFLSTHPSDERRIRDLQAQIPEAMKYYKR